ncbi:MULTISPECIES: hypothetical protein [Prevotellaceae]|uniref:hypothetical protein n=1 Tax=Prevotellaceae TaxID=171552 RepID=UPI0003D3A994|nr:hypothetical protein [Prevotella phocaeensis]ETD18794.1 hypothetical protein HMPREF1199_01614 [Hoylesella oralis CC98A]
MKRIYEWALPSSEHIQIEQQLLVMSWEVKGEGGQGRTPVVDENPDNPIDDKSFAKPYHISSWDKWYEE